MLDLIKGFALKPGTLIATGVILVLVLVTIFFYRTHNQDLVTNVAITQENGVLKQNEDFTDKSKVITDAVVTGFVQESKKSTVTTDTLRRESINEYVKKIDPVGVPKSPASQGDLPDGADRVSVFADSMHQNYCRARPEDIQCNPVSPAK